MGILEAIIYGIVQGIAEFLPISSSGHLALFQNFFGTNTQYGFEFNIALHLGTLVSIVVVFRKEVLGLIQSFFSLAKKLFTGRLKKDGLDSGERLFLVICIATLPLIPLKLLGVDERIEFLGTVSWAIGALLILNGVLLFVSDRIKTGKETVETGGFLRPVGVGLMQAFLGIMPGISRSGSTITGGRFLGYSRDEAVRFSFLMAIPAILGACVAELPDVFDKGIDSAMLTPMAIGAIVAATVGFFAIKLLQYLTKNKNLSFFAIYCMLAGIAAIIADVLAV